MNYYIHTNILKMKILKICYNILGKSTKEYFRSSLTSKLPFKEYVNEINKFNRGIEELTLEYMYNDVYIIQHDFSTNVRPNEKTI